jgi:hypothetical protein
VEGAGDGVVVTERQVQPGLSFGGRVVVREGLDAGVRLVVEGNESLQQGQQVMIREER